MSEQFELPPEPPLGNIVRLEPDDGRRWKRTSRSVRNGNWELWSRRTDRGWDGDAFLGWIDILLIAQQAEVATTVQIVKDDLLPLGTTWRTGRHLGRSVYRQVGDSPSDDDPFLGLFDSAETAQLVCELVSRASWIGNAS